MLGPPQAPEPTRRVHRENARVETVALADREQIEPVPVVRYEDGARTKRAAVDDEALRGAPVPKRHHECPQPRERLASTSMLLAVVDELRVEAEGDVVQKETFAYTTDVEAALRAIRERAESGEWIAAVETDVAGEVVPRSPGDADEGHVALDGDLGDRAEGPVSAGDPEHIGLRVPRELGQMLAFLEHVNVNSALPRSSYEILVARAVVARVRIHEQQPAHRR